MRFRLTPPSRRRPRAGAGRHRPEAPKARAPLIERERLLRYPSGLPSLRSEPARKAPRQGDDRNRHHRQDGRHRGPPRPIQEGHELLVDERRHDLVGWSAQEARCHQRADRQNENKNRSGQNPRGAQRKRHFKKSLTPARAKDPRGFLDRTVNCLDGAHQKQHHERKENVGETDKETSEVEHQPEWTLDQSDYAQGLVDQAAVGEEGNPAEGSHDQIEKQRENDENCKPGTPRGFCSREEIGQGITNQERHGCNDRAQQNRPAEDLQIIKVCEETDVVLSGEALAYPATWYIWPEANRHQERERRQKGPEQQHQARRQQPEPASVEPSHHGDARFEGSTMTSSAAISSWRASPRWNIAAEAGTSTCTSVPPLTPTTYWTEAPLNARNTTVTGTLFAISGSFFAERRSRSGRSATTTRAPWENRASVAAARSCPPAVRIRSAEADCPVTVASRRLGRPTKPATKAVEGRP